jgi:hypothetical protein
MLSLHTMCHLQHSKGRFPYVTIYIWLQCPIIVSWATGINPRLYCFGTEGGSDKDL